MTRLHKSLAVVVLVFTIAFGKSHGLRSDDLAPSLPSSSNCFDSLTNGDFNNPPLPSNTQIWYDPQDASPWTFTNGSSPSGITSSRGFTVNGTKFGQYAFMEAANSQISVCLEANIGIYQVSWKSAGVISSDVSLNGGFSTYQVQVLSSDGSNLAMNFNYTTMMGSPFTSQVTYLGIQTPGSYILSFTLVAPSGMGVVLIDDVTWVNQPCMERISDGGFQFPPLESNQEIVFPTNASPWFFVSDPAIPSSYAGISGWDYFSVNGTTSGQYAFLQGFGVSIGICLNVSIPGIYSLDWLSAGRDKADDQGGDATYEIQLISLSLGNVAFGRQVEETTGNPFRPISHHVQLKDAGLYALLFGQIEATAGNISLIDNVSWRFESTHMCGSSLNNGDFDLPPISSSQAVYSPDATPWWFSGTSPYGAGISGWEYFSADGTSSGQWAFLQGPDATLSTCILIDQAGIYQLNWQSAGRAPSPNATVGGSTTYNIRITSQDDQSWTIGTNYSESTSNPFRNLSAQVNLPNPGQFILTFWQYDAIGDNSTLIDNVEWSFVGPPISTETTQSIPVSDLTTWSIPPSSESSTSVPVTSSASAIWSCMAIPLFIVFQLC